MSDIGKAITNSARVISQVGQEIDALIKLIKSELINTINQLHSIKVAEGWHEYQRNDLQEWICTDYACSIGLKPKVKGRKKAVGYLSIQISLFGDGINVDGNDEPLLHVTWFDSPVDFDEDFHLYFPVYVNEEDQAVSDNKVLLNWNAKAENWQESGWAFTLRLDSINNVDDIKHKIVNPVKKLFEGKTSLEALSPDMPGLVLYEPINEEKGLFKVATT